MGILTGDPASPILWTIYISDFALTPHPDDIVLGGRRIAHLELADDIALLCLSPVGTQLKLHEVEDYCASSFLTVNTGKTVASVHGPLPAELPALTLYGARLRYEATVAYVGTSFTSSATDIFRSHYDAKAEAAQRTARALFCLESYIGPLPPQLALRLYHSHVDPHLIAGCEIVLDARPGALLALESIQKRYLRRALHVSPRSPITPLYTESGVWPLRYRRIELALRFLLYALRDGPPLVQAALEESWSLAARHSSSSWWSDLHHAAAALPAPLSIPVHSRPTPEDVTTWIALVPQLVLQDLGSAILASERLDLVQMRLRWDGRNGRRLALRHACSARNYLALPHQRQRTAMARLFCSEHPLAVELLRRGSDPLPREDRACRWCRARSGLPRTLPVEDAVHVLLECDHPSLTAPRDLLLELLERIRPNVRRTLFHLPRHQMLPYLLEEDTTLTYVASFVADVWDLCESSDPTGMADA
ncbi:hypothetical protein FKP32DRAFT_1576011 [Trametes sanguinea]|nr:hypothetical protein FKP32DRAFT_1576011 [Trametes sanguinea]